MRIGWGAIATMAVLVFAAHCWSAEPINLKVLYAGDRKSDRTADSFEFRSKLRVDQAAAQGSIRVMCEFSYQACDLRSCQPPTKENLEAEGMITD